MSDSQPSTDTQDNQPPVETAFELVAHHAHLRGHAIATAATLGIFDCLGETPRAVGDVTEELGVDPDFTHRLLRALASVGVVESSGPRQFALTPVGARFQSDHPESLSDFAEFLYAPDRLDAVKHFPTVVATGKGTGYDHEFGKDLFDYCEDHPTFASVFNGFQDISSIEETDQVIAALSDYDFSSVETVCDVGGGYGSLIANLLVEYPHLEGIVLELPSVLADEDRLWASKRGVEDRCRYVAGDMFASVPAADLYFLKAILHDWSDSDCIDILSTLRAAAPADGRLLVRDRVISDTNPDPESLLMDVWMLLETGGRERTLSEFQSLFQAAGWRLKTTYGVEDELQILEAVPSEDAPRL